MRPLRVAIVSRSFWPYVKGGAEKFAFMVSRELVKLGFHVTVITRIAENNRDTELASRVIAVGPHFSIPLVSSYLFSRRAANVVNKLSIDVVLVNTYWGEAAPLYIKRRSKRPSIIAIIHDVGLVHSEIAKKNIIKHMLRMHVLRRVIKVADLLIVPTIKVRNDLINFFDAPSDKIYVLGVEGVDAPFRRIHDDNEYFDVVQVARFAPNKGHNVLLDAIELVGEKIPGLRVWLVGGLGPGSSKKYLDRLIARANYINKRYGKEIVIIRTNVPDVSKYYRLADVCVAASVAEEGYGLTIPECLGYGKPVIASDLFAELGTARPEFTYIYPRYSAEALAQLLLRVYNNFEEALFKAERGMRFFEKAKWSNIARTIATKIQEIIDIDT